MAKLGAFFAIRSQMIRRILVNHARHRQAKKRGGTMTFIAMTNSLVAG